MPALNWIGKEAIINHDKEVQFRLLKKIKSNSFGDNSENLIIHGDNLDALKALIPHYQGKIKCIYIDPPYNTGNENWIYNDKVNSPKIKKWLGKVVGGESEDLCRHDKWLCMMYPRLKLLKDLLTEDGVIFISIDDNEQGNLRLLLDEIFGLDNFIATIIWEKKYAPANDAKYFSDTHDYVVAFGKNKSLFKRNLLPRTEAMDARYINLDNDYRGPWKPGGFSVKTYCKAYDYPIKTPMGKIVYPPKSSCWSTSKDRYEELLKDNRIWFGKEGTAKPQIKQFLSEVQQGMVPKTLWFKEESGHNQTAKAMLKEIFFDKEFVFETPKPIELIKRIITITCSKNDVILDSFAGSGTTGHAVMQLNKEDGGNRKFILIEMEDKVAKDVTAERIKRVIKKYDYIAGFEYCELDKPLFDEQGFINEDCSFEQLATYVYFTETNTNIDKRKINKSYIGSFNDTEYYLIFDERNKNVLTKDFLKKLSTTKIKKVVYADKCLVDELILEKYNIIFKQIPYEIKVF